MSERISEERLQRFAESGGDPGRIATQEMARELLAAREEIAFLRDELTAAKCCDSHKNIVDQLDAQLAVEREEIERLTEAMQPEVVARNVAEREIECLTRERDEALQAATTKQNIPVRFYADGRIYAVMGTSSVSYVEKLRARLDAAREMLQAARDHLKYDANSESGLVARIDAALEEPAP